MNLNKGHRSRLRERFIQTGRDGLCEHEILELLLFYAIPRRDVKPVSKKLLERFGSLHGIFAASPEQLLSVEGIGKNSAVLLKLIETIGIEMLARPFYEGVCLKDPEKLKNFLVAKCRQTTGEKLFLLVLDKDSKLLDVLEFPGVEWSVAVSKQDLLFNLLSCRGARQVIMCHNHPGNNSAPSSSDIRSTLELKNLLNNVSISLIEHFIVAGGDCFSMMKHSGDR